VKTAFISPFHILDTVLKTVGGAARNGDDSPLRITLRVRKQAAEMQEQCKNDIHFPVSHFGCSVKTVGGAARNGDDSPLRITLNVRRQAAEMRQQ
jgi:hypothetical protein